MKRLSVLALCLAAHTTPVSAQQSQCAPRETVLDRLNNHYGESLQASGRGSNDAMVELFAAPGTGTWTITVTLPNGLTCLVASGESYQLQLQPAGFPV